MKQYKDLRESFKTFMNESIVVGLQPLKEDESSFERDPRMSQDVRGTKAAELFVNLEKLEKELKEYESIIKDLKNQQDAVNDKIDEFIRPLELLNSAVIRYRDKAYMVVDRVAHTKETFGGYKTLWESALTKVNDATKQMLVRLKNEHVKVTPVKATLSRITEEGVMNEGFLSDVWEKLKNLFSKATSFFIKQEKILDDILSKLQ